ncbi:MAG: hypothetical protein AWT59_1730 [Candidatus Gallionella acididurans]|uniref:Uncharacterized protein n=1 Tax=Candidatus Gallionella acididurans TaxID=1796491 RepID=A0A139BTE0_9PROT|nr:MAG: hypothetical protein AWT59_1730 [Candidatus Gallionella acididurans]
MIAGFPLLSADINPVWWQFPGLAK